MERQLLFGYWLEKRNCTSKDLSKQEKHIILKTEDLSIGYLKKKEQNIVTSNISVTLNKGEFVAILGKNGIGKSTFLRTISKVQPTLSGNIALKEKNLKSYTNNELSKTIGVVLTERLPESQLTVFEIVAFGRQPYTNWVDKLTPEDKNKVEWAIQETEIKHLKDKRFYELSDGQLQRALIARALAQDTEIIILDEPTAHLDLHHTLKIFNLLQKLTTQFSKTVIISTHQLNLALQFANNILLFTENEVIEGDVNQLSEKGAFDNLFPKECVSFNKDLKQFVISNS